MSTRRLRSHTAAEKRQLRSNTAVTAPARPIKRRKKAESVLYRCQICDEAKPANQFPNYNPSSECNHLINTCKECLKTWVDVQIEGALFKTYDEGKTFGIGCPECPAIMRNVNVQIATDKQTHEQFEKMERKHIADNTPGWRWCLDPRCTAGQVHESTEEADVDIFTCHQCGAQACVTCDRPVHPGETCSAYQARIKDRIEEEDSSLKEIKRITKKCPRCNASIEKNGGCSHMICASCHKSFYWV